MNKILLEYRGKADEIFKNLGKYACFSRNIQLQKDSIEVLKAFKEILKTKRIDEAKQLNNDLANGFASFELVADSMINEFQMWVAIKEGNFNDAWDFLIDSQDSAIRAIQAHDVNAHLIGYIKRLELFEKIFFPPQLFLSDRSIISQSSCSICKKDMQECEHIKGKFYMGEQCCEVIGKIESINGFDFVMEPANKKCRVLVTIDGDVEKDYMTLETISKLTKE